MGEVGSSAGEHTASSRGLKVEPVNELTPRLVRRIQRDFPAYGAAEQVVAIVRAAGETERVQAAVVIWGHGDVARIRDAHDLALADLRDVLVRADLADEDWAYRLDAELSGP